MTRTTSAAATRTTTSSRWSAPTAARPWSLTRMCWRRAPSSAPTARRSSPWTCPTSAAAAMRTAAAATGTRNKRNTHDDQRAAGRPPAQLVKKASQSSHPQVRKKFHFVFSGDMCVGKNTSQPASVEFVLLWRENSARGRLHPSRKRGCASFSTASAGGRKAARFLPSGPGRSPWKSRRKKV